MPEAPIIFICYRRQDSGERAHRLHDFLSSHFGDDRVFVDLNVPLGADVRRYITDTLSAGVVLLAVIGPDWVTSSDPDGTRRLDSELDYVRLELATALDNNSTVVPVLVNGAKMPVRSELPPEIARLAGINPLQLSDGVNWRIDIGRLITFIEQILAAREPAAVTPVPLTSGERPRPRSLSARPVRTWNAIVRHPYAVVLALAALAAVAIIAIVAGRPGDQPLRIYSSFREREQQQPLGAADSGSGRDPGVKRNQRTMDIENAMRLALKQAGYKAGDFDVVYKPLDSSDAHGESPAALIQENAHRAANDDDTAVYIGDFGSAPTQESIPILSRARVPQLSMSSTRVGLTKADPRGDVNEPGRYYPPQQGYPNGYRNFVRIIPHDVVQARALLAYMTQVDDCRRIVMIDDDSSYGEALASNIRAQNRSRMKYRVKFLYSESVGPYGNYKYLRSVTQKLKPDCFVYSGSRNPNTVPIFESFAGVLPRSAKLYGTDGLVTESFYNSKLGGIGQDVAKRVKIMVPPYDDNQPYQRFVEAFQDAYDGRTPTPYVVYAYEAMQVALKAIADSGTGKRKDILASLFNTTRDAQDSVLGRYSITKTRDTNVKTYGVSTIEDGELTPPKQAPRLLAG